MLGSWLIYLIPGLLGTGVLSLVATKRGRRLLKRGRDKLRRNAVRDSKDAWRAHKKAVASTPRGKLRAKRRRQAPRLTIGRRRTADDPVLARRAARRAKSGAVGLVQRAKVARANRKASRRPKAKPVLALMPSRRSPLDNPQHIDRMRSSGLCGHRTQAGGNCMNPKVVGGDRCHVHGGRSAA